MTQKDTEFPGGSLTELEITEKERTFKLLPTFSRPNSERISKDFIKSKPTEVSGTDGVSESEVSTPRQPAEEESLLVSKERKSDHSIRLLFTSFYHHCLSSTPLGALSRKWLAQMT